MLVLVVYDIADDKRRLATDDWLGFGGGDWFAQDG
jgi:CRISPR/Cas system-associated endoribonuclease Cas2